MDKTAVAVFSAKPYDQAFLQSASNDKVSFHYFDFSLNAENAVLANHFQVVSAFVNDDLDRNVLTILANGGTKLIALRSAGYNHVDLLAAQELGITVVNVPAYSPYAVAEHTIALMLALSRKLPRAYNRVRDGNFSLNGLLGFDFYGKVVGIIGGGKIGRLVGERLKAFGCHVLIADPINGELCRSEGFDVVDNEQIFQRSDIISLHCPLVDQTRHLVNDATIAQMKQGVMLINTSRGGLIDTRAVLRALKAHHIAYLGIDVYEEEDSLFFEDHSSEIIQDDVFQRLITLPNVMVTGHQAYFTKDALEHIAEATVSNISCFLENKPLKNLVKMD